MSLHYMINNGTTSVLAQSDGGYHAPTIAWNIPPNIQDLASKVAFLIILVWVVYLISQVAVPSQRNRMRSGQVGFKNFVGVTFLVILLLDLSLVPPIVNAILKAVYSLKSIIGL